jgi:hypothetical protein
VQVPGCLKNGHQIQRIELNFHTAASAIDKLHEEHPEYDAVLFEVSKKEIKRYQGVKPPPICPRGHSGTRDGRPVVTRNSQGKVSCGVCGFLGD